MWFRAGQLPLPSLETAGIPFPDTSESCAANVC